MKSRREFLRSVAAGAVATLGLPAGHAKPATGRQQKPNVVMIVIDDLNDYVTGMGGHPQARTPHMAKLAASGVRFQRAYSNNPVCAPSRGSFFTGIYPHTSRLIHFGKWYENEVLINSKTLPEHFRDNGYRTLGTGKLLHHWRPHVWDEFGHRANYSPFAYDGKTFVGHPSVPEPFRSIGHVDGSFAPLSDVPSVPKSQDAPGHTGWIDVPNWKTRRPLRYVDANDRDLLPDERCAQWAVDKIRALSRQTRHKPFFLGVGFIRPHTPLYAPKRFFDMFPLENIQLPVIQPNDAADTHYKDVFTPEKKGLRYFQLLKQSYPTLEEGLRTYVRAYLACVAFVDEQVGKVVDAVDRSPFRDNTIILLTSDHGYNLGQKDYLFKNSLWEESGRVPLIIRAPGVAKAGEAVEHPVSLIDIYPTLADLCSLEGDTRKNAKGAPLDGHSLKPFLMDPANGKWDGNDAALTVIKAARRPSTRIHEHHYAIRTRRWRYILYNNGDEELYDHEADPREWTNLAEEARYRETKSELKARLVQMTGRRAP
jgi:arylsulfatase A-like enzyme